MQSPSGDGNDVIVTARRTSERLQDVPVSVSVLSGEDIRRQQLDGFTDIAKKTPGFAFEQFGGQQAQPTVRGQTNLRVSSPVQNVGSYINGVYLQRGYFIDQGVIELNRIEIIKGPQSALYGRNAFAGAINMTAFTPDAEAFSGTVSGTVGTDERYDVKGRINIPIIPGRLAVFAAGAYSTFDGTWRNNHPLANADSDSVRTRGNLGGYEKYAYQVGAKAVITDSVSLEGLWIHTERKIEQVPSYARGTANAISYPFNTLNASPVNGQNRLFVGELPVQPVLAPGETRLPGLVVDPRAFGLRGPTDIVIGRLTFTPGGPLSFEYLFGYTGANISVRGSSAQDPLYSVIAAGTTYGTIFDASGTGSGFRGYSNEARFNFDFGQQATGFFGLNYSNTSDTDAGSSQFAPVNTLSEPNPISLYPVFPGAPIPTTTIYRRLVLVDRKEDVWSAFAYVNLKPSDKLAIALQGRYTIEDQRAIDRLAAEPAPPFGLGSAFIARDTPRVGRTDSFFVPNASITYSFTPQNNVYATVGKGYKSGGINNVAASFTRNAAGAFVATSAGTLFDPRQQFYEAETNWTYEIGTKNTFFDRRLQLNASVFFTDWKDIQSNAVRLQPNGLPPVSFAAIVPSVTGNVGSVHVYGAEIEGYFRVTPDVRLDFGASYSRAQYRDGTFSQRFGAAGNCNGIVCSYTTGVPGFGYPLLDISGNQLERTPRFNGLAGLNYETEFSNGWSFFARGDVTYQTKQFVDEANLAFVPDRTLVNATLGVTIGNISANLWVKNLFDKKYVSSALFLIGTSGAQSATYIPILGEQRTAGLTAAFNF